MPSLAVVTTTGLILPGLELKVLTIEVGSSREFKVGLASSGETILVDVTTGLGGRVLPEGSTVRTVVMSIVGPGGVITVTLVVGLRVLDSLVIAPMLFIISASRETSTVLDVLVELLEVDVEVAAEEALAVVVSITGACGACGMKKFGEMLMGWELQSQPATTAPALLVRTSLEGMLFTRPMTV